MKLSEDFQPIIQKNWVLQINQYRSRCLVFPLQMNPKGLFFWCKIFTFFLADIAIISLTSMFTPYYFYLTQLIQQLLKFFKTFF